MEKTIKFSVLVPVYNVEKYLHDCIQSVLGQTYQNFELILVDDGSKDTSGAICDRYAQQDPRIRAYHKENGGQLHTRQFAISKASGDYYVFLDSDDTLCDNALETICQKVETYDCDCVVYQLVRVCNGKVLSEAPRFPDQYLTDKSEIYAQCLFSEGRNAVCLKAVKASVLSATTDYSDYYHVRRAEDLLQSIEILQNSRSVVFIDDALYRYTINPTGVTGAMSHKNYKVDFSVRAYLAKHLQSERVWDSHTLARYRGFCAGLLCNEVLRVCRFEIPKAEKKRLLREIRVTSYYKDFLCGGQRVMEKKRKLLFELFRMQLDTLLIMLASCTAKQ